jgi:5-aminolevulinate synthase
MQVSQLLRYSGVCPFLGHSSANSLRALAAKQATSGSALTLKAIECPMMGPTLVAKAGTRGYASVAGNREVEAIHKVSDRSFLGGCRLQVQMALLPL